MYSPLNDQFQVSTGIFHNWSPSLTGNSGEAEWIVLIAKDNGADKSVIDYFAFLHDSRRFNEDSDPDHGKRAAEFALSLRDSYVDLSNSSFSLLVTACEGHTHEGYHDDVTIQTCWDADRLDLGRVGITPDPDRMCTGLERQLAIELVAN